MELDLSLQDSLASLAPCQARLAEWLPAQGIAPATAHRIEIVFEELATNVIKYAHGDGGTGLHRIAASLRIDDRMATLVVEDDGAAFDPRSVRSGPVEGTLEEQVIGGLGLLMVQRMAAAFDYDRTTEGRNRVTVRLALG